MAKPNDLHTQMFVSIREDSKTKRWSKNHPFVLAPPQGDSPIRGNVDIKSTKGLPSRASESEPLGSLSRRDSKTKRIGFPPILLVWHPHGESNPGFSRERAAS